MDLKEGMGWFCLDSNNKDDLISFAGLLKNDDVPGKFFPDELKGMDSNDVCEWEKEKNFINKQIHGISFESVSSLFRTPLPAGYRILFDGVDPHSTGKKQAWGTDERSFVVAMTPSGKLYVAEVDKEWTNSGKVRLITAFVIKEKEAAKLAKDEDVWSSANIFESITRYVYRIRSAPGEPVRLRLLREVLTDEGAVSELKEDYGLGHDEAESVVSSWHSGNYKIF
jgi:uncharacterized DUF497 family protein